ncbi:hypothetical protein PIB30_012402 [Stylosanthes scabra]|uniref:Nucleotide-binding alpha-beta plait domain-containing protein n=1 Tax=Stylosanthes scabra TaxID=79078 RepID=A0ABU6R5Z7_9FABA|nr:hypothetical protein [Stylosanthes scabra]
MRGRVRAGASWREALVRGKHCEASGFACKRQKGESMGWGTSCAKREMRYRSESTRKPFFEEGFHTVFANNLSIGIRKRELFEDAVGAGRAIDMMNGGLWRGRKIVVQMSKYRRMVGKDEKGHDDETVRKKGVENTSYSKNGNTRMKKMWVEVQMPKPIVVVPVNLDEGKMKPKEREIVSGGVKSSKRG